MAERLDSLPLLSEINCPTLILVGEQDGLTPPADAKLMAEKIKKSQIEIIPGAGHLSNLEQPDHFTKAVRKFLESL
jgi:3-oxoadipate enol-lactonase